MATAKTTKGSKAAEKNEASTVKAGLKTGTKIGKTGTGVGAAKKGAVPAKPAKAAKPAKSEGESSGRKGRAPAWPLETKIKVLVAENPKRKGTSSYDRFALYGKNPTVGEFLAAGGTSGDLHWDSEREYIKIG